jgi:hypothetical protein
MVLEVENGKLVAVAVDGARSADWAVVTRR